MPNKLTIRIETFSTNNPDNPNEEKTVSKFVVVPNDQVTFQNRKSSDSEVEFETTNPLCHGNDQPVGNPFQVPANTERKLKVCANANPGDFEYTATVAGALPEDPILIVEKALMEPPPEKNPIFFPEDVSFMTLLVVAGVAAVAGFVAGRFAGRRKAAHSR